MPRTTVTGAECDVVYARRRYCYTQKPGVTAGIKRQIRRRERRAGAAGLRRGQDW